MKDIITEKESLV